MASASFPRADSPGSCPSSQVRKLSTSGRDDYCRSARRAACWAHTRRKVYEIGQADGSPIVLEAVRRIAESYALEGQVRGMVPAARLALRQ